MTTETMLLPDLSHAMGYTTRKTVRKQLGARKDKGGINLFIQLKKLNLNQIDGRNIRLSVQKRVDSSK